MLELGSSGSVRGVSSNGHPYRDPGPITDLPARTGATEWKHDTPICPSVMPRVMVWTPPDGITVPR